MRFSDPRPKWRAARGKWHRWFAWHPIKIGKEYVWLEWLERRDDNATYDDFNWRDWQYRHLPLITPPI